MSQESAETFAHILGVRKEYLLCWDNHKTTNEREGFLLYASGNYDKMIAELLLFAFGMNIDKMLIESTKHPKGGVVTDETKLLCTDEEIIKNVENLPADFKITPNEVDKLWLMTSINGEKKIVPRNLIYNLQKDIMDYAEFKCKKFVDEYWDKEKPLAQFIKEHENEKNEMTNSNTNNK